jgi:hypothetical protein
MCCSKLPSNRTLLLQSRAPTILLRLLLDVLHALEEKKTTSSSSSGVGGVDIAADESSSTSESNATAKQLQELIEVLASDMLASSSALQDDDDDDGDNAADAEEQENVSSTTLRLLLSAIETSSLSRPLRNVIAKLLPYLTYGQKALSKELAFEFVRHVSFEKLGEHGTPNEQQQQQQQQQQQDDEQLLLTATRKQLRSSTILMATFVHASVSLPPNDVCNSLRFELMECGFLKRLVEFIMREIPNQPPSWSPSLWSIKTSQQKQQDSSSTTLMETQWRDYVQRSGLKTAFDMLIGLSKQHEPTQRFLGTFEKIITTSTSDELQQLSLIRACHWIEATSDNTSARICMNGLGLVAEMLLDELAGNEASKVAQEVRAVRRKTRDRKKEIAMEQRSKALVSMSSFSPLAGTLEVVCLDSKHPTTTTMNDPATSTSIRGTAASLLAPILGLFRDNHTTTADSLSSSSPPPAKRRKKDTMQPPHTKPAWMAEMEDMEDETGLTCAVCQEGRTVSFLFGSTDSLSSESYKQ